ncbi:hypothetical protein AAE02nite_42720 [Adhaeribacter aerolatus]|uniref:Uncharacterized protein n=1 Tax=Adhaeribacter aerolatus TaxID=670289 RepID=A0A512B3T0_9BACT|nr:hypothetical protein [Adhaeribacter aerolatus]GEO06608.1 hypothetical protein AAE02nite_42720 [Adhaeribacter aerolatus]
MRKIHIILDPRDAKDSPELLKALGEVFQQDNLTLNLSQSQRAEDLNPEFKEFENRVFDESDQILNLENSKIDADLNSDNNLSEEHNPNTKANSKLKIEKWYTKLKNRGVAFGLEVYKMAFRTAKYISDVEPFSDSDKK